nr:YafY family protein [Rhizobium sp. L1K21]
MINILTTLQARGLVSAGDLAEENGVSLRTIYRDIDELAAAGIPVYSERGPEGGYRLLEGYRVRLNGLSPEEAEALFLSGLSGPATILGLGSIMTAAQKKLSVALPEKLRESAERMRARFHLDTSAWFDQPEEPAFIQDISSAVWNDRLVKMRYRSWQAEKERTTAPLSLVLKNGAWYLIGLTDGQNRTYRVSRIQALDVTNETFQRPKGFDVETYWRESAQRLEAEMHPHIAKVRVSNLGYRILTGISPAFARARMEVSEPDEADGWRTVKLPAGSTHESVSTFLRLGAEIEVLEPPEFRQAMREASVKIHAFYN